jgi:DNA-binding response OmpR family regulator
MKILVIEDDERVGSFLKDNLMRENYSVDLITNYAHLTDFIDSRKYVPDLFIMDRLLGNQDTKDQIKILKQKFPSSLVLFLSALNSPSEKALLLDEGADDYMGKPFSLMELQARVRALMRRKFQAQGQEKQAFFLQIADLIIDFKTRSGICNGTKIELTAKEYSLLINFCENRNKVFSKYQLLDIIWETNLDIESNVLELTIMNLRKKLDQCNSSVKILSKRNVGYWLEA